MVQAGQVLLREPGDHIGDPVVIQEVLRIAQLEDAPRCAVHTDQEEPVPVLSGMLAGGEEGMHRRAIEEGDLAQVKDDRDDVGPFQMHHAVHQGRCGCDVEFATDGDAGDPVASLKV